LPHLVAAALAFATPNDLLPLAASGWRDTTRIAGADPDLWRPIFDANRNHVLEALDRFDEAIAVIREALEQGDEQQLNGVLERARWVKTSRDALGD
jgi:3-phosphoshikimate 1-carboxyvinyltransferase